MSLGALKTTPAEDAFTEAFGLVEDTDIGRHIAWGAFARTGLPHRRMEDWRWSDVRRAAPEALTFPPLKRGQVGPGPFSALNPIEIPFVDGRFAGWPGADPEAAAVVRVLKAPPAPAAIEGLPLGALAAALAPDPEMLVLFVTKPLARPIWLRFVAGAAGAARLSRISVVVGAGASATLFETHEGEAAGFGSALIEARVQDGGALNRVVVQKGAADDLTVSTADVRLSADASFNQATLAFGAKLARIETHVTHEGEGSSATLDGAYLLDGARHADQTTVVTHAVPGGTTRQLVKGAAREKATGVFQGRIVVDRGAQKTDARMGHHALLLTEGATVNAKPELVIYADDVQCAHGNTAGALDPDQLYYLESRGIPEPRAKALVTEAFVAEAFERVADERVRELLLGEARAWLRGVS